MLLTFFLLLIVFFPLVSSVSGITNSINSIQVNTINSLLHLSVGDTVENATLDPAKLMKTAVTTTGLNATGPVAVLEDADPWGYNSVEDILNSRSVQVDVIPSASFGFGTSLYSYQKVIISSVQSVAFYNALETNRTWIESYVWYGGVLEVHAATLLDNPGEWILPGDFGLVWNTTENVEIADPTHYVLNNPNTINAVDLDNWINSAYGYFNNTDDASIILTDGAGEPVLIEQRYGLGYIIATAQPVEYAYGYNGYTDFLENLVWYLPTTTSSLDEVLTGSVAVLQDANAWWYLGVNATQEILVKYGIDYDIIPSSSFGTADLSAYQKVIISADQDSSFYTALGPHKTWLENYVSAGGILEVHAATQGANWTLPGNIDFSYTPNDDIEVSNLHYTFYHTYWIHEPEFNDWGFSTNGYFTNTADSLIILTDGVNPVFVEKEVGDGFVIATGQTLERAWHNNYSYFLENLILYVPHQIISPQPDDYLNYVVNRPLIGKYFHQNYTFGSYLDEWRLNTTIFDQGFYSNDTMYENNTYWISLHTGLRYVDAGTVWWVGYNYPYLIPTMNLMVGSVVPYFGAYGIIDGEVDHTWVNGLTYECWNVSTSYYDYHLFEKSSGTELYYYNSLNQAEGYTAASNLVPQPPTITVTSPNGGEKFIGDVTVTWDAADVNQKDVLTYNLDYWDGDNWNSIVMGLTTTSYEWISPGLEGDVIKVRVKATDGRFTAEDESDAAFTIDNLGPMISDVTHSPSSPTALDTVNVTAEVTDLSGLQRVELFYTVNDGSEQDVAMTKIFGNIYAVDFPVNFAVNDQVKYHVEANDNNDLVTGSMLKSFTVAAPPGIPGFSLAVAMLSLLSCGTIVYLIQRKRR